jgi:hypothetical protein
MSKYNNILSEFVKQTSLKKIRIKSDPNQYCANTNQSPVGYEGYILEETPEGNIVVYVPELEDNILSLGSDEYESCDSTNSNFIFALFKDYAIQYLVDKNYLDELDDTEIIKMDNISDVHELEVFLKNKNFDDKKLIDLYKSFIHNG